MYIHTYICIYIYIKTVSPHTTHLEPGIFEDRDDAAPLEAGRVEPVEEHHRRVLQKRLFNGLKRPFNCLKRPFNQRPAETVLEIPSC